jgi:hypothetical protein
MKLFVAADSSQTASICCNVHNGHGAGDPTYPEHKSTRALSAGHNLGILPDKKTTHTYIYVIFLCGTAVFAVLARCTPRGHATCHSVFVGDDPAIALFRGVPRLVPEPRNHQHVRSITLSARRSE